MYVLESLQDASADMFETWHDGTLPLFYTHRVVERGETMGVKLLVKDGAQGAWRVGRRSHKVHVQ